MATIIADADLDLARVRVTVLGATGGTLTRTDSSGTADVRGGANLTGDVLVDDYDAPFGEPLTYELEGATDITQLDVGTCWLSHPTDPLLGMPVIVQDDQSQQWTSQAPEAINVLGSSWPVAVSTRRNVNTGELIVHTTWEQRAAFEALILPGSELLLRTPAGAYLDTMWIWPRFVGREKMGRPGAPARLRWTLDYQRVADPVGYVTQDPTNSYTALLASHPTYDNLLAGHITYLDVLATAHPHAVTP